MVICLEQGAFGSYCLRIVWPMLLPSANLIKIRMVLPCFFCLFWGCPGKEAIKRVFVSVCKVLMKYCYCSFMTGFFNFCGIKEGWVAACVLCSWKASRLWVKILPITADWSRHTTHSGSGLWSMAVNHCCPGFTSATTSFSLSHSHRHAVVDYDTIT